jgi:hypothetical protein
VVYDRKRHFWNSRDLERIVKVVAEDNKNDIPMMSSIADRVLFQIARFLNVDQMAELGVGIVGRLLDLVVGFLEEPSPRITTDEEELLAWMTTQAQAVTDSEQYVGRDKHLAAIRSYCSSIIEYIDKEIGSV